MARPRVPDVVKELRGTLQPCRAHGEPVLAPDIEVPAPPEHLEGVARQVWTGRAEALVEVGLWSPHFAEVLEGYCIAYARALEADAVVKAKGLLIDSPQGEKGNPAVTMARQWWSQVRAFGVELGFTPAHAITRKAAPGDQTADELFGGDPIVIQGGRGG